MVRRTKRNRISSRLKDEHKEILQSAVDWGLADNISEALCIAIVEFGSHHKLRKIPA